MNCLRIGVRSRSAALIGAVVATALGILSTVSPVRAEVRGLSYTFTPTLTFLNWGGQAGLDNTQLLGGRLGIGFGRYLALEGYFEGRNSVSTSLSGTNLPPVGGNPLGEQNVDLRHYGADVVFNLKSGRFVPYVKLGGGILQLNTEEGITSKQIALDFGGGLRVGLERVQLNFFVQDMAYQMNRYRLASGLGPILPEDPDQKTLHNLAVGAGVELRLGGYRGDGLTETDLALKEQYRGGLRGLSVPIYGFVGSLNYGSNLPLSNQELVGIAAGLNMGPYVTVSGYYWRGMGNGFAGFDPVQSWGGEAQFYLSEGTGVLPFLIAGVGQLDFLGGSFAADSLGIDGRTLLILGGGLSVRLSDRFDLRLAARNYVFNDLGQVALSGTSDLSSNWMFSAGLSYALGGRTAGPRASYASTAPEAVVVAAATDTAASATVDSVHSGAAATPALAAAEPTLQMLQIPVPKTGEIVIRYGAGMVASAARDTGTAIPDSLDMSALRAVLREEILAWGLGNPAAAVDTTALREAMRTAMAEELALLGADLRADSTANRERMRSIVREELSAASAQRERALQDSLVAMEGRLTTDQRETDARLDRIDTALTALAAAGIVAAGSGVSAQGAAVDTLEPHRLGPSGFQLYAGGTIDSPHQGNMGVRLGLGPMTRTSKFHVVPEFALGFGSDLTSYLLAVNLVRPFKPFREGGATAPYLYLGVGYLGFGGSGAQPEEGGVVNLGAGIRTRLGGVPLFAEFQGIDFFDVNRILIGIHTGK